MTTIGIKSSIVLTIMFEFKSKSLGEKVLIELVAIIAISQINRFNVIAHITAALGLPSIVYAVCLLIVWVLSMALLIAFITHLIRWVKTKGRKENTPKNSYKETDERV